MHERTTRKSVTFLHPFSLAGVDGKLEAGTYLVETLEEAIESLSFIAYRRVSTTIEIAAKGYGQAVRQVVTIDPRTRSSAGKGRGARNFHGTTGPPGRAIAIKKAGVGGPDGLHVRLPRKASLREHTDNAGHSAQAVALVTCAAAL